MSSSTPSPDQQPEQDRDRPVHPLERGPAPQPTVQPPAEDQPPSRRIIPPEQSEPRITYVLLAINVIVFIIDLVLDRQLTMLGWKENQAILNGEYWRLITPMFLHGGILHLGFNSYFLYIVGPQIERAFGPLRFLAVYFVAGFAGSVASFALTPNPSIGASGALFGLLGAFIPYLYRNREKMRDTRRRMIQIAQIVGINLLIGLTPGIDNWAHIGGLLGGMAMAWFATPVYDVESAAWFSEDLKLVDVSNRGLVLPVAVGLGIILIIMTYGIILLRS